MAAPKVTKVGAGYLLSWTDDPIAVLVDRIRESSDFVVSAEVTIKTTSPGVLPHLHQARLNLTSTQARGNLAKHMEQQYSGIAPWPQLIEQMSAIVLLSLREGEPVYSVAEIPPCEGIKYRLRPFLLERQPTLIYGEGGSTKSLFAQYLSLAIALPILDAGYDVEPGPTLYLDYETDQEDFQRRCAGLSASLGYPLPTNLYYRRCSHPIAAETAEIQRLIADKGVQFVVVDSAGLACGGHPQDESMVIPYFGALRQLGVTTLTIAHVAKNAENKTPFGSVFWINMPRSVYEVKRVQNPGENTIMVGLYHKKVNSGMLQKAQGFRFQFSDTSISIERTQVADVPELAGQLPLWERIREMVRHGAMTVAALSEELGVTGGEIRARLSQHKEVFVRIEELGQPKTTEPKWGLRSLDR